MRPDLETQRSRRGLGYHIRRLRRFAGRHRWQANRNSVVWRAGPDRRPTEKSKRGCVRRPSRLRDKRAPATPRLPASIADRRWFSNDLEAHIHTHYRRPVRSWKKLKLRRPGMVYSLDRREPLPGWFGLPAFRPSGCVVFLRLHRESCSSAAGDVIDWAALGFAFPGYPAAVDGGRQLCWCLIP